MDSAIRYMVGLTLELDVKKKGSKMSPFLIVVLLYSN